MSGVTKYMLILWAPCPLHKVLLLTCSQVFIDSHVRQKPYQSLALLQRQLHKLSSVGIFGVPSTITTDSRQQFESSLWQQLIDYWAPEEFEPTAYHTFANSLVEWFHHQLKASLMCLSDPTHWVKALILVLL